MLVDSTAKFFSTEKGEGICVFTYIYLKGLIIMFAISNHYYLVHKIEGFFGTKFDDNLNLAVLAQIFIFYARENEY